MPIWFTASFVSVDIQYIYIYSIQWTASSCQNLSSETILDHHGWIDIMRYELIHKIRGISRHEPVKSILFATKTAPMAIREEVLSGAAGVRGPTLHCSLWRLCSGVKSCQERSPRPSGSSGTCRRAARQLCTWPSLLSRTRVLWSCKRKANCGMQSNCTGRLCEFSRRFWGTATL